MSSWTLFPGTAWDLIIVLITSTCVIGNGIRNISYSKGKSQAIHAISSHASQNDPPIQLKESPWRSGIVADCVDAGAATSYSSLLSWVYSCWWCWYQYLYHSVYAGICIGLAACGDDTVLTRYWHLNWSCCGRGWCCCWHWADSSQYGGMSVVFFHSTRYSSSSLLRVKASLCKLQRGFENGSCSVTSEKEVKRKRCESDVKTMWKWCKIDVKYIDFTSISRRFYVTFTTIAKKDELSRIKRTIQYNTHSNNTIKLTT